MVCADDESEPTGVEDLGVVLLEVVDDEPLPEPSDVDEPVLLVVARPALASLASCDAARRVGLLDVFFPVFEEVEVDEPADELDEEPDDEPEDEPADPGAAEATPGLAAIHAPMPRAIASAPTRPMYVAQLTPDASPDADARR